MEHDKWMYKKPDNSALRPHLTKNDVDKILSIFQKHTMYIPERHANAMYMMAEIYGTVGQPLRNELREAGFTVVVVNHYPNIVIIWRPYIEEPSS